MKKLSCIIIDDEPVARKILNEFVENVPFMDLQGKFENAMQAENYLSNNVIDLIFLDIEMPKVSGLQFLQKMDIRSLVIITTAFPKYALEGYELDIIDYLLKPFAFSRFLKAVQKAKDYYQLKNMPPSSFLPSYIYIKSDKRIEKIELNDILYVESLGNYVSIYAERKKIIANQPKLPEHGNENHPKKIAKKVIHLTAHFKKRRSDHRPSFYFLPSVTMPLAIY